MMQWAHPMRRRRRRALALGPPEQAPVQRAALPARQAPLLQAAPDLPRRPRLPRSTHPFTCSLARLPTLSSIIKCRYGRNRLAAWARLLVRQVAIINNQIHSHCIVI